MIRFGLSRSKSAKVPKTRQCDVGLFNKNTYHAVWIPSYRVHSGPGSIPGAWQVYKNFLIHEGSPDSDDPWGSYGCIEVVGHGEWARFLDAVKVQSGVSNQILSNAKKITVHIEQAAAPAAHLVG